MRARPSLSTSTAISCRVGRRRLPHESQPWWTTSARPLRFRAVHKSCETVESSRAYPLFGYLSVEVRHPNVCPGPISTTARRAAGSHMNPEPPARHPSCLPPSSNLIRVIKVLDHVAAAQRIEKLRNDPRSLAPELEPLKILDRAGCDRNVISGRFRHPLSAQRRRQKPLLSKGSALWS